MQVFCRNTYDTSYKEVFLSRNVMHNSEGKLPGEHHVSWIGPLQLAIHVVQNRHAGEQKTHWGKQTKGIYTFKINSNFLCLSCPSTTFALKCFGLVPREWLDAKGLLGKQNIQAKKVFRVESPAEKKTLIFFTNFVPLIPLANKNTSSQPQNRHIHKTSAKGGTSRNNAYPHIVFAFPINYMYSGFN